jgi:4-hydroxy-tetrahydrodipicolinate synthase
LAAERRHVQQGEAAGAQDIIPSGSTGEQASLGAEEHSAVIETTVEVAWTPLLAGVGAIMAREAIELTQHTADVGVDGGLITYLYYTWTANSDILRHYGSDGDAVDIPIVIYNIPMRMN